MLAAAGTRLDAVAAALADAAGASPSDAMWVGERRLDPETAFGANGLRAGSVLTFRAPERDGARPGVLSLHVVGGRDAGRLVPLERGRLVVGRAPDCGVVLADDRVSRRHAEVRVRGSTIHVADLGSANGTFVDGVRLDAGPVLLRAGQLVRVGDTLLTIAGPADPPAATAVTDGEVLVNRAPRYQHTVAQVEISVPERTRTTRPRSVQVITALLPAAAGGAIAWLTHSPQFLLFALLSPLMMISSALGDRVHWRRSRRREAATYQRRRAAADAAISDALARETTARRAASPDPAAVLRMARMPTNRVWERRRRDPDAVHVRLGSADLPSACRARTGADVRPAGAVRDVPYAVDLRTGPLGLAGPPDVIDAVAAWLVAQLAALHSPVDLDLVLLLAPEAAGRWAWSRWLPQLRGRVAVAPADWAQLVAELAELGDRRRRSIVRDSGTWAGPWTVLLLNRAAALADLPGLADLLADGRRWGLTAICLDTDAQALPTACASIAHVSGDTGAWLSVRAPGAAQPVAVLADQVTGDWAERVARALAPLVDSGAAAESALPSSCRLLDLLDAADLAPDRLVAAWAASTGRPDTVLGRGCDGPLLIDLLADGPHALVAGTTGAGKSELLQALVAGLATRHPPDEITFLLVDYKGGAAFAECAGLPHTVGLVTDLDARLTSRALQSLDAELRRRERVLAAAGVDDLDGYRRDPEAPALPRLVIVVDEFAALAEELPEFVRGLVSVAQRGRSLGVHLVLATQRPGSAVSAEIRANTSLRIALRVTDPSESTDVVDVPDAASIPRSLPGRAILRNGTTPVPFQTARVSGSTTAMRTAAVVPLGDWRRMPVEDADDAEESDLARLVAALTEAARRSGRAVAQRPWLEPLPDVLPARELPAQPEPTSVPLGLVDLPALPAQPPLVLDLAAAGSWLITGRLRSGRTSALSAIAIGAAAQLSPDRLEIYVADPTGALADTIQVLPHVATCAGPPDASVLPTLLRRLEQVVAERPAAAGPGPLRLLLLDGWDTLLARMDDTIAARCADALAGLLRSGPGAGLTVAASGDRTVLAPRTAGGFTHRLLLRLDDRADFGLAGIPARSVPARMPPGRALRAGDAAEVQLAYAGEGTDRAAQLRAAHDVADRWRGAPASQRAIRIRRLPDSISLPDLPAEPRRILIGLGGDEALPLAFDPFAGARRFLVAGPPRSGRTTALAAILAQATRAGQRTVVAAGPRSPLGCQARAQGIPVISPDDDETAPPSASTLLLVDDSELFVDSPAGERLTEWLRSSRAPLAVVAAGRSEDLATTYRGVAAEVRRSRCGLLLRPGPVDGDLLGVRLPRTSAVGPPGRGVIVGDAGWGPAFVDGEPLPVQVVKP